MNKNTKKIKLIYEWIKLSQKMNNITKYLFEHTELYEQKYMIDFEHDLFRFFAGKIGRHAKDYNKLVEILNEEDFRTIRQYNRNEIDEIINRGL